MTVERARLTRLWVVGPVALLVAFAAGFVTGNRSASPGQAPPRGSAGKRPPLPGGGPPGSAAAALHAAEGADEHGGDRQALAEGKKKADADLFALVMKSKPGRLRELLAQELFHRLEKDPSKLQWALEKFRQERDPALLEIWSRILGRVEDPLVLQVVQQMALDPSRPREARLAALRTLGTRGTPDAIPAVRGVLEREADADLVKAAIHALPRPKGLTAGETGQVAAALSRQISAPLPDEVRRTATVALGDWSGEPAARTTLLSTLQSDRAPSVRAAAAFGLSYVTPKDGATLATLAAKVQDRGEDWLVRENAWRALGTERVLGDDFARVYQAFTEERKARR